MHWSEDVCFIINYYLNLFLDIKVPLRKPGPLKTTEIIPRLKIPTEDENVQTTFFDAFSNTLTHGIDGFGAEKLPIVDKLDTFADSEEAEQFRDFNFGDLWPTVNVD